MHRTLIPRGIILGLITGAVVWWFVIHTEPGKAQPERSVVPVSHTAASPTEIGWGGSQQTVLDAPDWTAHALLLVDVQSDFWNSNPGATEAGLAQNFTELLEYSRSTGLEVIHIRSEFDPDMKDWPAGFKLMFGEGIPCVRGSEGARPMDFGSEEPGERVFVKHSFDGFSNEELSAHLTAGNKRHLLIAGLTTDVCVLATAFSATNQGYLVSLIDDCCFAESRMAHAFIMERYDRFLFDAVKHDDIPF